MMFAHVIGAEPGLVVKFDQLQPIFVLFAELVWPVVVLIEDAELHRITPSNALPGQRLRDLRPAGRRRLDLTDTTIGDQVDTGTIAAIVGCEKQNGQSHLFRAADPTERRDG